MHVKIIEGPIQAKELRGLRIIRHLLEISTQPGLLSKHSRTRDFVCDTRLLFHTGWWAYCIVYIFVQTHLSGSTPPFRKMRFVSVLCGLAATASALGELAFNLGANSGAGVCKTSDDYKKDFEKLAPYSKIVRLYSASSCNSLKVMGAAAENAGFQVFVGIWPTDASTFQREQATLKSELPKLSVDTIKGITVGSESLYRKDLSVDDLAAAIITIKKLLKDIKDKNGKSYESVPVGTVDSWNIMVDGATAPVIKAADMVFVNAFSYWQGQTMANSSFSFVDDIMQALQVIQTEKGTTDLTFWVGETGWPTEGSNFGASSPGTSNAAKYWKESVCGIRAWGINVISFEAFDEPFKSDTSGTNDVEKHWGVFDAQRNMKYDLTCDFS